MCVWNRSHEIGRTPTSTTVVGIVTSRRSGQRIDLPCIQFADVTRRHNAAGFPTVEFAVMGSRGVGDTDPPCVLEAAVDATNDTNKAVTAGKAAEAAAKFVYDFAEGNKDMKDLLGGKGANLAEMTN